MEAVGLPVVVGPDDVGVGDAPAIFGFAEKSLHGNRVSRQTGAKDLHCRRTTFRVLGAIDGRCAAFADISLEVLSGDSPTDQRVSVHAIAKLVNPRGGSKLERSPMLQRA
jgi:hypothetical protein